MIDAHRGAFEFDWRARFHKPLNVIGRSMSWGEAIRLTELLAVDPAAHVAVSLAGWEHPVSRESMILMDLFDLQHASKAQRTPKPYPRPWPDCSTKRTSPAAGITQADVIAALRNAGHVGPLPQPGSEVARG